MSLPSQPNQPALACRQPRPKKAPTLAISMPGHRSHAVHLATNQPARNRNLRNQKLDVKASQRNAVMSASGNGVGGGVYEGGR